MRRAVVLMGLMMVAALSRGGVAEAQFRPVQIGISGGPSTPVGDFGSEVDTGYHVQGSVDVSLPLVPIGIRADALWQEFGMLRAGGSMRQIGVLGNAIVGLPVPIIRPYVLAGAGLTNSTWPEMAHGGHTHEGGSEARVSGQIGAGVRGGLLGLTGVIEARLLGIGDPETGSIPVSIGILF
jgi:hypothetical protein